MKVDKPNNGKSPVISRLTISCGCGFLAQSMKQAGEHALQSEHVMTVHGQIGRPERLAHVKVVKG